MIFKNYQTDRLANHAPNKQLPANQNSIGTILMINGRLLYATILSALGWYLWPETMRDFMWGFYSILLWLASFVLFVEAVKSAVKLYARDRAVANYLAQGSKPKTAEMASTDALRNAGMTDE